MTFIVGSAIIGGVASLGGAALGAGSANKSRKAAAKREKRLTSELKALERQRQEIINPYEGVTDLSSMIQDLSSMATNPFQNLGVATKGAEIQIEQSDIALANTLDTLQASGASAGGATALAQAALKSKQGVAASIEQQEANNEKLRLEGQQQLEQTKMREALRVQGALMGEAARMQQIEAQGEEFIYSETERRQTEQLNRVQAQITGQQQAQMAARQSGMAAITSGVTGLANVAGSFIQAGGATKKDKPTPKVDNSGEDKYYGGGFSFGSDKKLKKNIKLIGVSPSGLNIYNFEYKNIKFGKGLFQGVMSNEVPKNAIIKHKDGYDMVDYSKIDVKFSKL